VVIAGPPGTLSAPVTEEGGILLERLAKHLQDIRGQADENDRDGVFPAGIFDRFRADGVMGATVPKELGGLGVARLSDVAIGLLTLAAADASTALALHVQLSRGLTLSYEWRHGAPRERAVAERLLRMMATGEAAVCGAVKDHRSVITTLKRDGAGNWLLSGRKTLVSMAPIATHFIVHAQVQDEGRQPRLAAPLLRRDAPGLTVMESWDGFGMRASGTVDVVFDDCPVTDADARIRAAVGARDDSVLAGQTVSSATMLGIYIGIAQAARDATVAAVAGRTGTQPAAVRTLITEMDVSLYAIRSVAGTALANADDLAEDLSGDMGERGRRMMQPFQYAKLLVNRLAPTVVDQCLTLTGGAGYSAGHLLSRLYRDVRAGGFMQPYGYIDGVDFLSAQALGLEQDNDYMSVRAARVTSNQSAADLSDHNGGAAR
jgi:alkylation response protein AidB-like acyl-CoA dehydrogenase